MTCFQGLSQQVAAAGVTEGFVEPLICRTGGPGIRGRLGKAGFWAWDGALALALWQVVSVVSVIHRRGLALAQVPLLVLFSAPPIPPGPVGPGADAGTDAGTYAGTGRTPPHAGGKFT